MKEKAQARLVRIIASLASARVWSWPLVLLFTVLAASVEAQSSVTGHASGEGGLMIHPEERPSITYPPLLLSWWGMQERVYIMQWSDDLITWTNGPDDHFGAGQQMTSTSALGSYFRLKVHQALLDTDGDGLADWREIERVGSSPYASDTSGDGIDDGWAVCFGLNPLDDNANGLFQESSVSNLHAYSMGVQAVDNATLDDFDGDLLGNEQDAVPLDGEIDWMKSPECNYVWAPQVERSGAKAVSRHGHILFLSGSYQGESTASDHLWDSQHSAYVDLLVNSSWSDSGLVVNGKPQVFDVPWAHFIDMNDDGSVIGLSEQRDYLNESPFLVYAIMKWERTGATTNVYGPPVYMVPSFECLDMDPDPVREKMHLKKALHESSVPSIGDDGTVSIDAFEFARAGDAWAKVTTKWVAHTNQQGVHCNLMGEWATLGETNFDYEGGSGLAWEAGATLDDQTGLLSHYDRGERELTLKYRKENDVESLEGLLPDRQYRIWQMDISRSPGTVDSANGRVWFAMSHGGGDDVFIEKRKGGAAESGWHRPTSMMDGAIRLNARGEGITEGSPGVPPRVWRNGRYQDLNMLTSMPVGATITKAIDLASNGIILAEATHDGRVVTGLLVPLEVVPDWNRDGMIDQMDIGKVTPDAPFHFWVNNDDDGNETNEDRDLPQSDIDNQDMEVNSRRDLVDFFPVQLRNQELLKLFPAAEYDHIIDHEDGAFNFIELPVVQPESSPESLGAGAYLRDPTVSGDALSSPLKSTADGGSTLSEAFLDACLNGQGILVFESYKKTMKSFRYKLRRKEDQSIVAVVERALPVYIVESPEDYYYRLDLTPAAGGHPVGDAMPPSAPKFLDSRKDRWLVMLHGYNVNPKRSRALNSEIFKRLWHLGFDSKYVAVTWKGDVSQILAKISPDYWVNVYNAFASSSSLAKKINQLTGSAKSKTVIAAHSLGNMVASSAIEDHGLLAEQYLMINSAVAKEAYVPTCRDEDVNVMSHPDWRQAHPPLLWASYWHQLFEDTRSNLTWAGRFKGLVNKTTAINYYSSGEDIAMESDGSLPIKAARDGNRAWVAQEMFKGSILQSMAAGWFCGTYKSHGGWALNANPPDLGQSEAALKAELRGNPFFDPFSRLNTAGGGANYDPNGISVIHPTHGSALADHYSAKAWLLAYEIPALSNPMASGESGSEKIQPVDMQKDKINPQGITWNHGAFHREDFEAVYKVYQDWVNEGKFRK